MQRVAAGGKHMFVARIRAAAPKTTAKDQIEIKIGIRTQDADAVLVEDLVEPHLEGAVEYLLAVVNRQVSDDGVHTHLVVKAPPIAMIRKQCVASGGRKPLRHHRRAS